MKFATIAPIPVLQRYVQGDYHMVLYHLLKDRRYVRFYHEKAEGFKILDNSLIELGMPAHPYQLLETANKYGFDEVIAPDFMHDAKRSLAALEDFVTVAEGSGVRIMGVPQGATLQEWMWCYIQMADLPIHTIGIPKSLGKERKTVCAMVADHVNASDGTTKYADHSYHLLGIPDNPYELHRLNHHAWLRGCDSVLPVWMGMHGVTFDPRYGMLIKRPDFPVDFDEDYDPFPSLAFWNLKLTRDWAEGEKTEWATRAIASTHSPDAKVVPFNPVMPSTAVAPTELEL